MYNAALENSIRVNCTETIFTTRKRSLGQGNVFIPVCDSVHRRGVCLIACWDTPSWADTPLGKHSLGRHTPWTDTSPLLDTVNKQAVHILLECTLVLTIRALLHLEYDFIIQHRQ